MWKKKGPRLKNQAGKKKGDLRKTVRTFINTVQCQIASPSNTRQASHPAESRLINTLPTYLLKVYKSGTILPYFPSSQETGSPLPTSSRSSALYYVLLCRPASHHILPPSIFWTSCFLSIRSSQPPVSYLPFYPMPTYHLEEECWKTTRS